MPLALSFPHVVLLMWQWLGWGISPGYGTPDSGTPDISSSGSLPCAAFMSNELLAGKCQTTPQGERPAPRSPVPAPKEEKPFDGVNCGIPRGNLLGVDCRRRRLPFVHSQKIMVKKIGEYSGRTVMGSRWNTILVICNLQYLF